MNKYEGDLFEEMAGALIKIIEEKGESPRVIAKFVGSIVVTSACAASSYKEGEQLIDHFCANLRNSYKDLMDKK